MFLILQMNIAKHIHVTRIPQKKLQKIPQRISANKNDSQHSIRVKETVFRIHEHCSNRLYKDTVECIAYWNAIETFNNEIEYVYHTLKFKENPLLHMDTTDNSVEYDV